MNDEPLAYLVELKKASGGFFRTVHLASTVSRASLEAISPEGATITDLYARATTPPQPEQK